MVPTIHQILTYMIILDVSLSRRILLEWSICIPTLVQAEKRAESWQLSQKYAKISPQFWNIGSKQDEPLCALLKDYHNHCWFILSHKYVGLIPQKDFQNRSNQVPIFIERKFCAIKKHPVEQHSLESVAYDFILLVSIKALSKYCGSIGGVESEKYF